MNAIDLFAVGYTNPEVNSLDELMGYSPNDLLGDIPRPKPLQTHSKNENKRIGLQPAHKLKLWRLRPW